MRQNKTHDFTWADQDWIGLMIFKNFENQDWIGFKFFGTGLDSDRKIFSPLISGTYIKYAEKTDD